MKPIVVENQVKLSAARCLYLTLAGMYYRLTRSAITIAIVGLAVAFLAYMLTYSIFSQERSASAQKEYQQGQMLGEWATRLGHTDDMPTIVTNTGRNDTAKIYEYRHWAQVSDADYAPLMASVKNYASFVLYFETLRPTSRAVLLGDTDPYVLPARLTNQQYRDVLLGQINTLALQPPLGSREALEKFLVNDYPLVTSFAQRVQQGQQVAIDTLKSALGERSLLDVLIGSSSELSGIMQRLGFYPLGSNLPLLQQQAQVTADNGMVVRLLSKADVRAALARTMDIDQKLVNFDVLTKWINSEKRAETFAVLCTRNGGIEVPTSARMLVVAQTAQRQFKLQRALGANPVETSVGTGFSAMPQATLWLIIVSFIVCAVGICNTMFMSVTERFTEIATMKCLGAMDGFVMLLFVFEAIIQGVVGSLAGLIIGLLLTFLRGVFGYGSLFFESFPIQGALLAMGSSAVAGIVLAALSAVGPAWMAARLAPMEAMRVE